jgi:hypothetical protein
MLDPAIFVLTDASGDGVTVTQLQPGDWALRSFHLFMQLGFVAGMPFDPIAPVTVGVMIVQFVVNHFTNHISGI